MNKKASKTSTLIGQASLLLVLVSILNACTPKRIGEPSKHEPGHQRSALVCKNTQRYAGKVVGDGHCVALIKACSSAPNTPLWRAGEKVLGNHIRPGTVIATFKNGRYPNTTGWHAAIYIEHDKNGIWVWDQWLGKSVHKRLIRTRYDRATPGNTAQEYRVVHTSGF